jgi:hypothetical protein
VGSGDFVRLRTALETGDFVTVASADFESVIASDALRVRAREVFVGVSDRSGDRARVCDRGGLGLLVCDAQPVAAHSCRPEIAYVWVVAYL